MAKLKLAVYWTAACGGCDVAILDMNERIMAVGDACDIVLWPLAADGKYHHVEGMPDHSIDVCLFHGAIRNSENLAMARLLREKSNILVSFGSCASLGGIPGLANFYSREEIFRRAYMESESTVNREGVFPQQSVAVPEGELTLPEFFDTVYTLAQVVPVDYFIPGCPPTTDQIWTAVQAVVSGNLPPRKTVIAGRKSLCDECPRVKEEKKIQSFKRPFEVMVDPAKCLIEQGIVCCGPATRGGCGARCTKANMPCRGCFGPPDQIADQGAKLVGALASIIDSQDPQELRKISHLLADPAGIFYRFSLADSLLKHKRKEVC